MTTKLSKALTFILIFVFASTAAGTSRETSRQAIPASGEQSPLLGEREGGRFFISAENVDLSRIVVEIGSELGIVISGLDGTGGAKVDYSGEWESSVDMVKGILRYLGIRNYLMEFDGTKLARVRVMKSKGYVSGRDEAGRVSNSAKKADAAKPVEKFSFVKVQGVVEGSQAEALELMAGDFIVLYNGVEITSSQLLIAEVRKVPLEGTVDMVVMRDHEPYSYTLKGGMIGVRVITVKLPGEEVF